MKRNKRIRERIFFGTEVIIKESIPNSEIPVSSMDINLDRMKNSISIVEKYISIRTLILCHKK